jgi:hypothetical protein
MTDRQRIFIGFILLILSLIGAAIAGLSGFAALIGAESQTGIVLGLAGFVGLGTLAAYQFIKIRDWAWIPAVLGGVYAIVPDLMAGPVDDVGAILLGAAVSGVLAWRRGRDAES